MNKAQQLLNIIEEVDSNKLQIDDLNIEIANLHKQIDSIDHDASNDNMAKVVALGQKLDALLAKKKALSRI